MTWSRDKLKVLAAERGETAADTASVGRLLLAHERMKGRTEEDYPRDAALKELDDLLEKQTVPLPQASAREFMGLKQLRSYAADRGLQRAVSQSANKTQEMSAPSPAQSSQQPSYSYGGRERERG